MDALLAQPPHFSCAASPPEFGPVCVNGTPDALRSVASGNEEIARVLDAYLAEHEAPGYEYFELVTVAIVRVDNFACDSLRLLDAWRHRHHPELGYLSVPHAVVLAAHLANERELIEEIRSKLGLGSLFFVTPPRQDHAPICMIGQSGTAGVYRWGMGGDPCGQIGLVYARSVS